MGAGPRNWSPRLLSAEEPPALGTKHVGSCSRHPCRRREQLCEVCAGAHLPPGSMAELAYPQSKRERELDAEETEASSTEESKWALGMGLLPLSAYLSPALG